MGARADSGIEDVNSGVQSRFSSSCIAFDVVSSLSPFCPDRFDFPLFVPASERPFVDPKDFGRFPWGDVFNNSGVLKSCLILPLCPGMPG